MFVSSFRLKLTHEPYPVLNIYRVFRPNSAGAEDFEPRQKLNLLLVEAKFQRVLRASPDCRVAVFSFGLVHVYELRMNYELSLTDPNLTLLLLLLWNLAGKNVL